MQCPACGSPNRDAARFCRGCGTALAGGQFQPPPPPDPFPQVPPGTVVKEEMRSPGTILYTERSQVPVCGWLVVLRGRRKGRDFRIEKDVSLLGRDGSCDYVIEDDTVSRQHVRFRIEDGTFVAFDLGSGNGTFLNGEKIQRAELQDGDVLKIGESLVLFKKASPRIPLEQADAKKDGK